MVKEQSTGRSTNWNIASKEILAEGEGFQGGPASSALQEVNFQLFLECPTRFLKYRARLQDTDVATSFLDLAESLLQLWATLEDPCLELTCFTLWPEEEENFKTNATTGAKPFSHGGDQALWLTFQRAGRPGGRSLLS